MLYWKQFIGGLVNAFTKLDKMPGDRLVFYPAFYVIGRFLFGGLWWVAEDQGGRYNGKNSRFYRGEDPFQAFEVCPAGAGSSVSPAMYGAVDLMVVGQFGAPTDVSAVSAGSQIMQTVTSLITGLAMGITILVGQKIGEKRPEQAFWQGLCMRRMRPFPRPWIISGSAPPGPCSSSPTMS